MSKWYLIFTWIPSNQVIASVLFITEKYSFNLKSVNPLINNNTKFLKQDILKIENKNLNINSWLKLQMLST